MNLNFLFKSVLIVAATLALLACDFRGRAYEDLRLMRLTEGESTDQDVRKLFGDPVAVRTHASGRDLIYPLGPDGPYTLAMKIDANGKYRGRENLLTRANFDRVSRGMKERDVLRMIGRPGKAQREPSSQQSVWQWRFLDGGKERNFVVTFDANGLVDSSLIEDASRVGAR